MASGGGDPRIVRKTGEGNDRPNGDSELPIDINYQKLSEWLVSRQKLPADWHKRLQAIQAKVAEAAKELPPGLLAALPGGADAPVDYFRAVSVRDKLAEAGERSLFGGLTGAAGTWDKIVRAYENGGVYVGEAAATLVQNVDYEIPYLRKAMAKCGQQMADADRRHGEYTRAAATAAANYKKECEGLGIAGAAVGQELRQLGSRLPGAFAQLVQDLRRPELERAVQYYRVFTGYAHGNEAGKPPAPGAGGGAAAAEQQLPDVLPVLAEVRERRTPAYAPPGAAAGGGAADAANNAAAAGGIDWGPADAAGGGGGGGGIDWGADLGGGGAAAAGGGISWDLGDLSAAAADGGSAGGGAAGGISWDVEAEPEAAEPGGAAAVVAAPTLDWDIDLSGIGVESAGESARGPAIDWGIEAGGGGGAAAAEGAGVGADAAAAAGAGGDAAAHRLQHDAEYRARLLDDLQELRAFLVSRRSGLAASSSSGDLLRALAPEVVASTGAGDVAEMLAGVEQLLASLNDSKLRQLLLISSSGRYLERLKGSLQRKAGQEAKMLAAAAETQARKQEARATLVGLQPKLSEVVESTRGVKKAVEAALSKQFNGRRVNVLGEINNALAAA